MSCPPFNTPGSKWNTPHTRGRTRQKSCQIWNTSTFHSHTHTHTVACWHLQPQVMHVTQMTGSLAEQWVKTYAMPWGEGKGVMSGLQIDLIPGTKLLSSMCMCVCVCDDLSLRFMNSLTKLSVKSIPWGLNLSLSRKGCACVCACVRENADEE